MDEQTRLINKIHQVFLPGTPISDYDLFAERPEQMSDVMSAIMQPGRHVILFGERGVGKTSLAKVIVELQRGNNYRTLTTATMNCDESDDFTSLWYKVFSALPYKVEDGRPTFVSSIFTRDGKINPSDLTLTPDDIRYGLSLFNEPSLIVVDELDQLVDEEAKRLLTATVKNLSDHAVNTTIILIGVADTVNDLIVVQKSAERALVQVRMPRMLSREIVQIIERGFNAIEMTIERGAKDMVVRLSQRLPYYTHSLCLNACLRAVHNGQREVTIADVAEATVQVVYKAHNIRAVYHKAVASPQRKSLHDKTLLACALTETDDLGFFSAAEVGEWFSSLLGKKYEVSGYVHHLKEFCEEKRGRILQKVGEAWRVRYRFSDPMMQPFVIINAVGKGELQMHTLRPPELLDTATEAVNEDLPPF